MLSLSNLEKDLFQGTLLASGSSLACGSLTAILTWHSSSMPMCLSIQILSFSKDISQIRGHSTAV